MKVPGAGVASQVARVGARTARTVAKASAEPVADLLQLPGWTLNQCMGQTGRVIAETALIVGTELGGHSNVGVKIVAAERTAEVAGDALRTLRRGREQGGGAAKAAQRIVTGVGPGALAVAVTWQLTKGSKRS